MSATPFVVVPDQRGGDTGERDAKRLRKGDGDDDHGVSDVELESESEDDVVASYAKMFLSNGRQLDELLCGFGEWVKVMPSIATGDLAQTVVRLLDQMAGDDYILEQRDHLEELVEAAQMEGAPLGGYGTIVLLHVLMMYIIKKWAHYHEPSDPDERQKYWEAQDYSWPWLDGWNDGGLQAWQAWQSIVLPGGDFKNADTVNKVTRCFEIMFDRECGAEVFYVEEWKVDGNLFDERTIEHIFHRFVQGGNMLFVGPEEITEMRLNIGKPFATLACWSTCVAKAFSNAYRSHRKTGDFYNHFLCNLERAKVGYLQRIEDHPSIKTCNFQQFSRWLCEVRLPTCVDTTPGQHLRMATQGGTDFLAMQVAHDLLGIVQGGRHVFPPHVARIVLEALDVPWVAFGDLKKRNEVKNAVNFKTSAMCRNPVYDPVDVVKFLLHKAGMEDDPTFESYLLKIMKRIHISFVNGLVLDPPGTPNRKVTRAGGIPSSHLLFDEIEHALPSWMLKETTHGVVASAPIAFPNIGCGCGAFNCIECPPELPDVDLMDMHNQYAIQCDNPYQNGFPKGVFVLPGSNIYRYPDNLGTPDLISETAKLLLRGLKDYGGDVDERAAKTLASVAMLLGCMGHNFFDQWGVILEPDRALRDEAAVVHVAMTIIRDGVVSNVLTGYLAPVETTVCAVCRQPTGIGPRCDDCTRRGMVTDVPLLHQLWRGHLKHPWDVRVCAEQRLQNLDPACVEELYDPPRDKFEQLGYNSRKKDPAVTCCPPGSSEKELKSSRALMTTMPPVRPPYTGTGGLPWRAWVVKDGKSAFSSPDHLHGPVRMVPAPGQPFKRHVNQVVVDADVDLFNSVGHLVGSIVRVMHAKASASHGNGSTYRNSDAVYKADGRESKVATLVAGGLKDVRLDNTIHGQAAQRLVARVGEDRFSFGCDRKVVYFDDGSGRSITVSPLHGGYEYTRWQVFTLDQIKTDQPGDMCQCLEGFFAQKPELLSKADAILVYAHYGETSFCTRERKAQGPAVPRSANDLYIGVLPAVTIKIVLLHGPETGKHAAMLAAYAKDLQRQLRNINYDPFEALPRIRNYGRDIVHFLSTISLVGCDVNATGIPDFTVYGGRQDWASKCFTLDPYARGRLPVPFTLIESADVEVTPSCNLPSNVHHQAFQEAHYDAQVEILRSLEDRAQDRARLQDLAVITV